MPKQNRITPFGEIISTPARGTLMGNRGTLHNGQGRITKVYARKAWISCLTEYKGQKLEIMAPDCYTQLFFLDEVTALSAGHRPCGACRRPAFNEFKRIWRNLNPNSSCYISELDEQLHKERYAIVGMKSLIQYQLKYLPDGAFVTFSDESKEAWLKLKDYLYLWSADGYCVKAAFDPEETCLGLTPLTVIKILNAGYPLNYHDSIHNVFETHVVPKLNKTDRCDENVNCSNDHRGSLDSSSQSEVTRNLYKLKETPRGKNLHAYFAAILTETGLLRGECFDLHLFFRNLSTHEASGKLSKVDGGHQLTESGTDYFIDRFNPENPQHVDEEMYNDMIEGLRHGGAGWQEV